MVEIRIHGRGGQGVKLASKIISRAAHRAGYYTQDFAIYGAERQGAPVISSVRIDSKPIKDRGYLFNPNIIIILDDSISRAATLKGAGKDTQIYINTMNPVKEKNMHAFDATTIALDKIGIPKVNIAFLGAFVKKFDLISFSDLKKAVEVELRAHPKAIKKNIEAAKICYGKMK